MDMLKKIPTVKAKLTMTRMPDGSYVARSEIRNDIRWLPEHEGLRTLRQLIVREEAFAEARGSAERNNWVWRRVKLTEDEASKIVSSEYDPRDPFA